MLTGTQPGKLYGMAKHHKEGCPLRPVLSAVNTAGYALSKWLEQQIKPFLVSKWSVPSSRHFVEDLNKLKPLKTDVCVSFDIKSLYTNVPLHEVIKDVIRVLYSEDSNSIFMKVKKEGKEEKICSKVALENMLLACSESVFLFEGKTYKQIDGLSMGSPMAPLLANWFVDKIESKLLSDDNIKQPKYYRRYVDDIFAVFECDHDKEVFFQHLNSAHKNLQFTIENVDTSSRSLPFLDVEITITPEETFATKVYKKPTNTGALLHYDAMAPKRWKTSTMKWFLKRASTISSSTKLFESEVNNIRNAFAANGYPTTFINKTITEYRNDNERELTSSTTCKSQEDLKQSFMVLPYFGKSSERLHRCIMNEFLQHRVQIIPAYRTTKVESYFSLKSKLPTLFKSDVVYEFKCPRDEDTRYIGETERQLFQRVKEHCKSTSRSAVFDHIFKCDGCKDICINDTDVLGWMSESREHQ